MRNMIDLLDRGSFIDNVIKVVEQLSENKKGCCFAIEGGWGVGKTFVIEEVEERLKETQFEETNTDKYFVFHYNCWQYDYYEEPAIAIISAMIASIQKDNVIANEDLDNTVKAGCKIAVDKLKEIAGAFIENKIGVNLISLADEVIEKKEEAGKAAYEFDDLFTFSQTIERTRENFQEIAKERTIVLVVDELDRCIPQYAIKVLERLHHIFYGLENVVVIMAIDRKQLNHTVEEMFGAKNDDDSMDVEKYLKKFIDFSMVLDYGVISKLPSDKYAPYFRQFSNRHNYDNEDIIKLFSMLFSKIDIRSQEKIIEKANLVHTLICKDVIDISVMFFEIIFEVLKSWGVEDLGYALGVNNTAIISINEATDEIIDQFIGLACMDIEEVAPNARKIKTNFYGSIYFYFWKIFLNHTLEFVYVESERSDLEKELEITKKYCEFCKMIK